MEYLCQLVQMVGQLHPMELRLFLMDGWPVPGDGMPHPWPVVVDGALLPEGTCSGQLDLMGFSGT